MNTPDDATLNTHSTADHELKIGRAGKHGAGIARNMKGDDYDLNKDQRLMRDVAAATTGLKDRGLARAGRDLLLEGNFLRNAIQAGQRKRTWPLCVPRVDVSLPGCTLDEGAKQKIYADLASDFAKGKLTGTFKSNFVKRQRDAVRAATLRRRAATPPAGKPSDDASDDSDDERGGSRSSQIDYTPFQLSVMRGRWLEKCARWQTKVRASKDAVVADQDENLRRVTSLGASGGRPGSRSDKSEKKFWNKMGNRRLSVHSMLAPVQTKLETPADDGVCRLTLNPSALRDFSTMYPHLGFARRGVRATSRQAFTKYYEAEVLRPMRSTRRYDEGAKTISRLLRSSRSSVGFETTTTTRADDALGGRGSALSGGASLFAPTLLNPSTAVGAS